jgi:hypothetical protein
VQTFYERAAADDFDGAWALAGPDLRAAWGGSQERFEADLRSLQSIEFDRLEPRRTGGGRATIAIRTRAEHATYVDRCSGIIPATKGDGGQWLVGKPAISCRRRTG